MTFCRVSLWLAAAVVAAAAVGCQPEVRPPEPVPPPPSEYITVNQLAHRLGMQIVRQSCVSVFMKNRYDCITIYPEPQSAIFINSKLLRYPNAVVVQDGEVYVTASIEPLIRTNLPVPPPISPPILPPIRPPVRPPVQLPVAPPVPPEIAKITGTVVLDAGHGGVDDGATAVTGAKEKDLVLRVTRLVRQRLKDAGVKVIMTRDEDTKIELEARAEVGNRNKADLFCAIHADSAPENASASGHTVYIAEHPAAGSMGYANAIDRHLADKGVSSRGVRRARYRVLVCSDGPAVLIELGFLSNRAEANRLATDEYDQTLADGIAAGIVEALKQK